METYFLLRPAVYGQHGPETVYDRSDAVLRVVSLHFILDSAPADDLHKSSPVYLVSGRLGNALASGGYTGCKLEPVLAEYDVQYSERRPDAPAPDLRLLRLTGDAGTDDFGVNADNQLVVSNRVMALLKQFQIPNCVVHDAANAPTLAQMKADMLASIKASLPPRKR